jgi:hypothetical protein
MSDYKSEFVFTLETPLKYHAKGDIAYCNELTLKAPSNKQRHHSARLKQGFFRALKGMSDNRGEIDAKEEKEGEISGSDVISIIMMSNVDLVEYQESFRELLLSGACFAGDEKLTSPMYDSLSDSDTEKMLGEYVAVFLLASHLAKMMKK